LNIHLQPNCIPISEYTSTLNRKHAQLLVSLAKSVRVLLWVSIHSLSMLMEEVSYQGSFLSIHPQYAHLWISILGLISCPTLDFLP
jgi:hypothetical protein